MDTIYDKKMDFEMQSYLLNDATNLLQYGSPDEKYFTVPAEKENFALRVSTDGNFFEINIGIKSDMIQINRKTETLLDLLSACGGLFRALNALCENLINPYSLYALQAHLALNLVRFIPSSKLTNN